MKKARIALAAMMDMMMCMPGMCVTSYAQKYDPPESNL